MDGYVRVTEGAGDPAEVHDAIARISAGDHQALRVLYATYSEPVRRYVTSLVGDRDFAQDVTQSTFLKLLRVLHRYERRDTPFEAWLLRVARNVALDMMRQRRLQVVAEWVEEEPADRESAHAAEARRALADALAALPKAQREVVLLRHVVGLSTFEIAERLERSEAAVNNLHHRARTTLRMALQIRGMAPGTRHRGQTVSDQGQTGGDPAAHRGPARFVRRPPHHTVIEIVD